MEQETLENAHAKLKVSSWRWTRRCSFFCYYFCLSRCLKLTLKMHMFTYICVFMHVCLVVFIVIQWYRFANVCIPGIILACRFNFFCVNIASTDARDVFSSSEITFYTDGFTLTTLCPASRLNISASLCWMQHKHLCTPVLNSTLKKKDELVSIAVSVTNICGKKQSFFVCFLNTNFDFLTEIWHYCSGQTPSDVCAGEKHLDALIGNRHRYLPFIHRC